MYNDNGGGDIDNGGSTVVDNSDGNIVDKHFGVTRQMPMLNVESEGDIACKPWDTV